MFQTRAEADAEAGRKEGGKLPFSFSYPLCCIFFSQAAQEGLSTAKESGGERQSRRGPYGGTGSLGLPPESPLSL